MSKVLTAAAVERYRPLPGQRREIRDAGARGLYLVIAPNGTKSWALRFRRPDGKQTRLVLGSVDLSGRELAGDPVLGMPLTLPAARQLAAAVHRERAMGRDVVADRKAEKHRQRTEREEGAGSTFPLMARRFVDEHARLRTRRWRETARLLGLRYPKDDAEPEEIRGSLIDRWRNKPAREIDGHEVWIATDEARRLGIPGLDRRNRGTSEARARALHATLSSFFGWLIRQRKITQNPCAGVLRPPPPSARDRVLSGAEARWFWSACDQVDQPHDRKAPRPYGPLLRLLLLTGQRLNEVAGMTEPELVDGMWQIPATRTKNRRPHVVPLPLLARDLIANVRSMSGKRGLVFTTTGETPVSGWSKVKRRLDEAMLEAARKEFAAARRDPSEAKIAPWRLHDLRRTAVTGMAELGVRPDVIEKVVNHVSGYRGGVAGVYNRSELMAERRTALERWAAHVQGTAAGKTTNVVNLPRTRRG